MTTIGARRNNQVKQFLYRLKPADPEMLTRTSLPHESEAVYEHYNYLKQLSILGTVILMGRTSNDDAHAFGIVIIEVSSEAEARQVMEEDPAVVSGLFEAELFPFRVMLQKKPPSISAYSSRPPSI